MSNVTVPSARARASHTSLDMRAKKDVLLVFFGIVKL